MIDHSTTFNLADERDYDPAELGEYVAQFTDGERSTAVVGAELIAINQLPNGGCEVTAGTGNKLVVMHTDQCIGAIMRRKKMLNLNDAQVNLIIYGGNVITDRFGNEFVAHIGLAAIYDPEADVPEGEDLFFLECSDCASDDQEPEIFDGAMPAGLGSGTVH